MAAWNVSRNFVCSGLDRNASSISLESNGMILNLSFGISAAIDWNKWRVSLSLSSLFMDNRLFVVSREHDNVILVGLCS